MSSSESAAGEERDNDSILSEPSTADSSSSDCSENLQEKPVNFTDKFDSSFDVIYERRSGDDTDGGQRFATECHTDNTNGNKTGHCIETLADDTDGGQRFATECHTDNTNGNKTGHCIETLADDTDGGQRFATECHTDNTNGNKTGHCIETLADDTDGGQRFATECHTDNTNGNKTGHCIETLADDTDGGQRFATECHTDNTNGNKTGHCIETLADDTDGGQRFATECHTDNTNGNKTGHCMETLADDTDGGQRFATECHTDNTNGNKTGHCIETLADDTDGGQRFATECHTDNTNGNKTGHCIETLADDTDGGQRFATECHTDNTNGNKTGHCIETLADDTDGGQRFATECHTDNTNGNKTGHCTETLADPDKIHILSSELTEDITKSTSYQSSAMSPALLSQEERSELAAALANTVGSALSAHGEVCHQNIVINNPNLYLTKKTEVTAPRARNVNVGGPQTIQNLMTSEKDTLGKEFNRRYPKRPPKNPRLKTIQERTESDISRWTQGMIKTSFVDNIAGQIDKGARWVTITGNAGDGKTTTGYLVLEEMVKRGKEVFHVKETDQYYIVTENTKNSVIMLNDVLGAFTFDHTAMSKWEPVLHDALDNITKSKDSGNFDSVTVIFISRWNVLQGGKNMFGKFDILEPSNLFNLSNTHETVGDERLQILEYHLKGAGVTDVTAREKTCVASCITPHGFPHCCKIYADLRKTLNKINISDFFLCPLQFLDKTTKVLTEKYEHEKLFKLLIENDGKMDVNSIKDENLRQQICSSVSSLIGSYLTNNNGIIKFTHPSIYESVAYCIGRKDEAFAIEKFSFSFLMQKMKFTHKPTQEHGEMSSDSLFIQPTESNIDRLSDRFHLPILYRNFEVLHHPFFSSERFCEKVISSVTMHRRRCLFGCVCSQIKVDKIDTDAQDTEGNTLLLKSVQSRYLTAARVLIKHGADVNRADKKGRTPLHLLCWNKEADGETLKLMIKHVDDVNKADKKGCTPLHLLCYHKAVDAETLELMIKHGVDVNKADKYGFTPLHWLCSNEAVDGETLEMMIKHGADVNKADANGCIPFHYLCEKVKVDTDIVRLMIKHGADVNKADAFGDNSLIPLV